MMPLFNRLSYYSALSEDEFSTVRGLRHHKQSVERGKDIVRAGEPLTKCFVVDKGWGIRYQMLDDGRRQILNVLMPGDMFDLQVFVAQKSDHSVMAVTDMELSVVMPADLLAAFAQRGQLAMSLWWAAVQEESILRQQIVRNGRLTARERVAHFLLELHRRATIVKEAQGSKFHLPLTQTIIGDALGLSHIHVNRVLRKFMVEKLIRREKSWIELLEPAKLAEICEFNPAYLHLDSPVNKMAIPILEKNI